MIDKRFIGKKCDIIDLDAIFATWENFFEVNNLPKDNRWKKNYRPDDLKDWKIIEVGENKKYDENYPAGVFVLEKDNRVVIYDAEGVKIYNNDILKYHINPDYNLFTNERFLKKCDFPLKNFSKNFKILDKKDYKNWSLILKKFTISGKYYVLQKYLYGENHRIIVESQYVGLDFFDFGDTNNIWEVNLWNSI